MMVEKSKSILLLLFVIILTACSSTKEQTQKETPEDFTMQVQEDPEFYDKLAAKNRQTARGILLPFTGKAVSLAKGAVLNLIKKEEQRFTKTYRQAQSDLFFYNTTSEAHPLDPAGMQFDGLEVVRFKRNTDGRRDTTFFASFSVDTSQAVEILNNSIFRLKLDELEVNDTQLPGNRRWYLPWTWFEKPTETINLDVNIKMYASWVDESMNMKRHEPMGEFYLVLRNVPLQGDDNYEKYIEKQGGHPTVRLQLFDSAVCFIPKSAG